MQHAFDKLALARVIFVALLGLGLCLQPVLEAACEVADATQASTWADADGADVADSGEDECCPNQACAACCLHATANCDQASAAHPLTPGIVLASASSVESPPEHYPVDTRPPIPA